MKYQQMAGSPGGRSKRCVYCGRTFKVRENIVESLTS